MTLYGLILAGGSGTRFWPYSRTQRPKQILKLFSEKPMITETVQRLDTLIPEDKIYISTNEHLAGFMKQEVAKCKFVIEPYARNTAACIGLSAAQLFAKDPDAMLFIETADHAYKNTEEYLDVIRKGVLAALKDKFVLIGITPTSPHTGYGYIKYGETFDENIPGTFVVDQFKEKPDLKTAKEFLAQGDYLWNSGMFIAKASVILDEIKKHMPKLAAGLEQIKQSDFSQQKITEVFKELESISIDYGVSENSDNVVMVKADIAWDDIGDFLALERYFEKDAQKNVALSEYKGNAERCIFLSETRKIDVDKIHDLVVIDTPDACLIMDKEYNAQMKKVVTKLKEADLEEYLDRIVEKPEALIISHESEHCHAEGDGLLVCVGVEDLEIKRTTSTLHINGGIEHV